MRAARTMWLVALAVLMTGLTLERPASAADVQEVVGKSGVRAYLVRDPKLPFLSMSFQFRAGAAYDPEGKDGLANMLAGLLDEGAGERDSGAFQAALENNAIRLSFDADRDSITGSLKTLNEHRPLAFELLRDALMAPRFDAEPVERIRSRIVADLRRRESDPSYVASRTWFAAAFPDHAYGRPTRGTIDSVQAIGVEDLQALVRDRFARSNLSIGVAGDITPEDLATILDATFGELPQTPELREVEPVEPRVGATEVVRMAVPQSVVTFGHGGIARHDPDYYAAYVVNYILGGGGFSSRLMQEVREVRGLAYSVYSHLYDTDYAPLWLGGVATGNELVGQSIEIIKAELEKLRQGAISEEDLANAKTYLTGSFPLRLTSNDQIARMLLGMMVHDLGLDYLDRRNDYIDAVTLEDAKRVAGRLLAPELLVSVVGQPVGLGG
jgi:zinc protease